MGANQVETFIPLSHVKVGDVIGYRASQVQGLVDVRPTTPMKGEVLSIVIDESEEEMGYWFKTESGWVIFAINWMVQIFPKSGDKYREASPHQFPRATTHKGISID